MGYGGWRRGTEAVHRGGYLATRPAPRSILTRMLYDPYSRAIQDDPFPTYHHFLEHEPCTYNPTMDFYALFRFEDVWEATLDWNTYSSSLGPALENRGQIPSELFSIIGMDPPRQTRLRNLVSRGFTPKRIAALEKEVRWLAALYVDPLRGEQGCDLPQSFSVKLPMDVISVLLGIPEADRDWYRHTVDRGLERDPDTGQPSMENIDLLGKSRAYVVDLLAERRKHPREDLISVLAEAEYAESDDRTRRLSDDEVASFTTLLAAAGAETTAKLIGNMVVYLFRHPDQRRWVFEDAAVRLPGAIEEVLRYDAPSQFQGRVATRDVRVHKRHDPEGRARRARDRRGVPRSARVPRSRPARCAPRACALSLLRPRSARLHREVARAARDARGAGRACPALAGVAGRRGWPHTHLPGPRARLPKVPLLA